QDAGTTRFGSSKFMPRTTPLSSIDESLLVAAYLRGGSPDDGVWVSNSDQIVTLSLFYTGEISSGECAARFSRRSYVGGLYDEKCRLTDRIAARYDRLLELLRAHPELIEGGGDLVTPADPTYTSCRLTLGGRTLACALAPSLPQKPEFPNWPDKRAFPVTG
ncbi:MAG TPA: hypothetical protein VL475_09860, partial [Planctomycetaceae bacterium]|nr:hypothetical protein [Planctomycetaceae bacterium]